MAEGSVVEAPSSGTSAGTPSISAPKVEFEVPKSRPQQVMAAPPSPDRKKGAVDSVNAVRAKGASAWGGAAVRKFSLAKMSTLVDISDMATAYETLEFSAWLAGLADDNALVRIQTRIERLTLGNPGDVEPVGSGVSELRIHYGPGYRVYFAKRGPLVILLLAGGDKRTQAKDIKRAIKLLSEIDGNDHELLKTRAVKDSPV
jgi:putative addiction module killer protein